MSNLTIQFSAATASTAALFETPADLTADQSSRTIVGLALPYGVVGRTSQGPLTVRAGAIAVPADRGRVKLLRDHRPTGEPVGYLSEVTDSADGMVLKFTVGTGAAGDLALADANQRIRDGLSVELSGIELDSSGTEIVKASLDAVALVAIPAFADARVSSVLAAAATTLASSLYASAPSSDPAPVALTTQSPANLPNQPANPTLPAGQTAAGGQFAAAPHGLVTTAPRPGLCFSEVARTLQAVRQGGSQVELQAALADITRSANPWASPDGWIGELWEGAAFTREVVPLLTQGNLTNWKMSGWRWVVKPTVDDYVGNKTEIPSNSPTTESVSVEAKRLAGGHDIDRKFWDFNDADFIASYFRALTESYAYESDERAAQFIVASATAVVGTQPDLIRAVAAGVQKLKTGPTRARATFALVNPGDMMGLLDFTAFDVPEYLRLLGINPEQFVSSEFVPAGTVIVGAKAAATFYELGGSPIRVETVDIARGGRDGAVFGYYATLLHNAGGLVKVTIAPAIP